MTTTIRSSFILLTAVLFLTGYSFMSASWTVAPANPPANNAEAPINVSDTTQTKEGRLNLYTNGTSTPVSTMMLRTSGNMMGNILTAGAHVRSPAYCDETGSNCFDNDTIDQFVQSRTCPAGQFMRGVNADGTLVCAVTPTPTTPTTPPVSCSTQTKTVSQCGTSNVSSISCGTGWSKSGGVSYSGISCSTNGIRYTQNCIRTVCS